MAIPSFPSLSTKSKRATSILLVSCLICFFFVSPSSAQVSDVFSNAFKAVAGFSFSMGVPLKYTGDGVTGNSNPIAYSVKFAPLRFGPLVEDVDNEVNLTIKTHYQRMHDSLVQVVFDTVKYRGPKRILVDSNQHIEQVRIDPKISLPSDDQFTVIQRTWIPNNHLTLSLGYGITPNININMGGFSSSFQVNELFLTAVTRLFPKAVPEFVCGVTISAPQLSGVDARRIRPGVDTTLLRMSSPPGFTTEPFIGLSTGDFLSLPGFSVFVDMGYKFQTFRGLTYIDGTGKQPADLTGLPTSLDLGNLSIKIGLSFNIQS